MLLSNFNLLATAPGGVARLRELILTLAVQGKLVPQDPKDEPASALLKKIRAEKDPLIAEGKIKRDKPLAEISKEEKLFGLPESWELVRLNDLLPEFQNGASSRGDVGGRSVTVLRLADIKNRHISLADTRQIPIAERDILKYHVQVGDILITRVNGSADIVGQFNLCETAVDAIYCDHFIRMRLSNQWIEPTYLALVSESSLMRRRIKELFITTAGQKTVNQGHIGSLQFGLPPLAEQSRIVARVEELMRVCDALEVKGKLETAQHAQLVSTLLDTLTGSDTPETLAQNWQRIAAHFDLLLDRPEAIDAFEQTILQLAVRGLLVPQDPRDEPASVLLKNIRVEKDRLMAEGMIRRDKPLAAITEEEKQFEVPYGWEWGHLSNICIQVTDGTHQTPKYTISGRPFLSAKNVKPFKFMPHPHRFVSEEDFHALRKGRIPTHGDILMTRVGAMIGEAAEIDSDIEFAFYVSLALLSLPKSLVSPRFLVMWLNSPFGTAKSVEKTLGRGVSAGNLNLSFIRSFSVPLPPLREQFRIVTRVEELRRLCADLHQLLTASQTTQAHLAEALVESVAG